jgi:hypothetical protein
MRENKLIDKRRVRRREGKKAIKKSRNGEQ